MLPLEESIDEIKSKSLNKFCLEECLIACCDLSYKELPLTKDELKILYEKEIEKTISEREKNILCRIPTRFGYKKTFEDLFERKIASLEKNKKLIKVSDDRYVLIKMVCPVYDT